MRKKINIFTISFFSMAVSCAQEKDYLVTIKTDLGDMVAILYDETPKHKENFIKLVKEHYYDSLMFHRVIKNFMIQGGDPNSKNATSGQQLGTGGPGYTVEAEINPNFFHEKGSLSAARLGDMQNPTKASSGSQFYIVQGSIIPESDIAQLKLDQPKLRVGLSQLLQKEENKPLADSLNQLYEMRDMDAYTSKLLDLAPRIEKETGVKVTRDVSEEKITAYTTVGGAPHLDNEYTVFGKVIKGLDVIDKIAQVDTGPNDQPLKNIHFHISIEKLSKRKITKLYDYKYPERDRKK